MKKLNTENLLQKLKSLSFESCSIQGHNEENLDRVCIETKCQNKGIICEICKSMKHSKCKVITLNSFLKQFIQQLYEIHENDNQNKNYSIDKMREKNTNLIQSLEGVNSLLESFKGEVPTQNNRQQQLKILINDYLNNQTQTNFEKLIQEISSFSPNENQYSFEIKFGNIDQTNESKKRTQLIKLISDIQNKLDIGIQNYFKQSKVDNSQNQINIKLEQVQDVSNNQNLSFQITDSKQTIKTEQNKSFTQIQPQQQLQQTDQSNIELNEEDIQNLFDEIDEKNNKDKQSQINQNNQQLEDDKSLQMELEVSQQIFELPNKDAKILNMKYLRAEVLILCAQVQFQILNINKYQITPLEQINSVIICSETLDEIYKNQFLIGTISQIVYLYQYDEQNNKQIFLSKHQLSQDIGRCLIAFENNLLFMVNCEKKISTFQLPQFTQISKSSQFLQKDPKILLAKNKEVFVAGQTSVVYFNSSNNYQDKIQFLPYINRVPINLGYKDELLMVAFKTQVKLFKKSKQNKYLLKHSFCMNQNCQPIQFCQFLFLPSLLFLNIGKQLQNAENIESQEQFKQFCGIIQGKEFDEIELQQEQIQFDAKYIYNEQNSSQIFGINSINNVYLIKINLKNQR